MRSVASSGCKDATLSDAPIGEGGRDVPAQGRGAASRPEVGTQAQFRKKNPPKTYRYDSSLSPALDWDGQNPARERGEALLRQFEEADTLEAARAAAAAAPPGIPALGLSRRYGFRANQNECAPPFECISNSQSSTSQNPMVCSRSRIVGAG
jgi:hypothetical protein